MLRFTLQSGQEPSVGAVGSFVSAGLDGVSSVLVGATGAPFSDTASGFLTSGFCAAGGFVSATIGGLVAPCDATDALREVGGVGDGSS